MFPFLGWFCSLPRKGKALVDDGGLMLQTQWCKKNFKQGKINLWLLSVAQKIFVLKFPIIKYPGC